MADSVRVVRAPGPDSVRVIRLVDAEIARVIRAAEEARVVIVRSGPRGPQGPPGSGGGGGFYEVETMGTLTGVDDSALIQAAIDASIAGAEVFGPAPVRLRPGVTYRGQLLNPTGAWIQGYNSGIKVPDGGTAHNVFVPTGAFRLEGGVYNGNKGATSDPGVNTDGNAIYLATNSAGWAGTVDIRDCRLTNCWWGGDHFNNTDSTLHDPRNAPVSKISMTNVEVDNCGKIGQRFTGVGPITLRDMNVHDNGSHGTRTFLCNKVDVILGSMSDNKNGHGWTSLYCVYSTMLGGHYDRNGTTSGTSNGVTWGGDSTSNVNMPGQHIKMIGVTAVDNGQHNIIFDASLAGRNALTADADFPIGRTTNDPIPVYADVIDCTANGAVAGDGIIVNSSQYVKIHNPVTDHCGAHGISLATRNCTITGIHRAWYNAQKPIALQGATNWGDHDILCATDYQHNTPDDTMTIGSPLAPCRFGESTYTRRAVTSATTAKIGEMLALDTTAGTFAVTLPEIAFARPGKVRLKWIAGTVAPTVVLTGSDKVNTSTGTTPPTFAFLNHGYTLESDPVSSIWTIVSDDLPLSKLDLRYTALVVPTPVAGSDATNKTYVDGAVATAITGGLKYRGLFDASGATFPTTGGSGAAGAIKQSDLWIISVAGTLGGTATTPGDVLIAKVDTPGSTAGNWDLWEHDIGYTPENTANKDTDGTLAANSDTKYASQKATKTYVDGRRLDQAAAPTADVSMASHKLTNVTDPTSAQDAATKNYVDLLPVNTQTGTSYTFALSDMNSCVEGDNAGAITFTIPLHSTTAFPVNAVIPEIRQKGVGQINVVGASGVTVHAPRGSKTAIQWGSLSLHQRATDEWVLTGDATT